MNVERDNNMFEETSSFDSQSKTLKKLSLQDVPLEPTRHGALKKVLLRHEDVSSQLMFLNEVYVASGERLEAHQHEDMEEIFYFLDGKGIMQVGKDVQPVTAGDRVIVPMKTMHILENTGEAEMKFICFGVKVLPGN